MPDFHFLSSASVLASHYSALCSSFSTLFPVLPHRWFSRCSCSAHAFQVFPLLSGLVSRAFFPDLCTWLSVSFLSSFLASLPQLFRKCLLGSVPLSVPFPLAFSPSCSLSFVSFHYGSDYSASVSSFPFFPFQPHGGLSGAYFPHSLQLVSMFQFLLPVLSFPAFPFNAHRFATQVLLQLPASCFQLGRSP